MPSLAHLLLGAMLGLFLYYISDKKFTKCHVFILFVNNYLGPDVGWVTDFGVLSHNVLGFCFIALPLAVIFSYFTRFSPDFKRRELTDLGKVRVPYLNTYCLVVAGGTLHNYLDGIINNGGRFFLTPALGSIPGFSATIRDFIELWKDGALGVNNPLAILLGIVFIMGFIYYFTYFLRHTPGKALLGTVIFIAAFLLCFYLLGNNLTFHGDAGAIVYVSLFWVFPLGLITLSVKIPVKTSAQDNRESPQATRRKALGIRLGKPVIFYYFLVGAILLLAGVACLLLSSSMVQWVVTHYPFWVPYTSDLANFLLAAGITLVLGGGIAIFAGYKLKVWGPTDFRFGLFNMWLFGTGLIPILVAVGTFTVATPAADFVFMEYGTLIGSIIPTQADLVYAVQWAGIVLLGLGIVNNILGFGILMRSERWRRITFLYNICWAWSILGLVFACFLSQPDVRGKFQHVRDPITA